MDGIWELVVEKEEMKGAVETLISKIIRIHEHHGELPGHSTFHLLFNMYER